MRVAGAILCAGLSLFAATVRSAAAVPNATCGKLLAPSRGMYLGSAPDFVSDPRRLEGDTVTTAAIQQFEQEAGRSTIWAEFAQHWFEGLTFPRDKVMTAWRAGQIPYVRMESHAGSPYGQGNPPEQFPGDYSLQNIIDGKFDPQLTAWADAARKTNIPILAEFGIEENNSFGPWAGDWNGAGVTAGYGDPTFPDGPERFRDAYRHLVTLFRNEGATNVTWFFHVDTWYGPRLPWDTYANYYPGDDYVDWIGLSDYGWQGTGPGGGIPSFEQKLQTFHDPAYPGSYADITSVSSKPIALVEVAASSGTDAQRAAWTADMFATLASGRYPRLAELSWWNSYDIGTRLDLLPETQKAFAAGATSSLFDAKPRFSGNCLPAAPTVKARSRTRISWTALSNATSYEVWRNGKRIATTTATSYHGRAGKYHVRGLNPLGAGPFG
jgi:hypothetical protein